MMKQQYTALIILCIIVTVVWAGTGALLFHCKERGSFGDMFGAVNALFAGLAFAGIIYTIHLQRQELELQRKELQLTREEISGQKAEMHQQNAMLELQTSRDTFFQMIRVLNDVVAGESVRLGNGHYQGRNALRVLSEHLSESLRRRTQDKPGENDLDIAVGVYEDFYGSFASELGHYFRTLYTIIKYVDETFPKNPKLYTNLVRAQLSDRELVLLYYNCLSRYGKDKFKPYVEKYALLKNLPPGLLHSENHRRFYGASAFE